MSVNTFQGDLGISGSKINATRSIIKGDCNTISGNGNTIIGDYNVVFGDNNQVTGYGNITDGKSNTMICKKTPKKEMNFEEEFIFETKFGKIKVTRGHTTQFGEKSIIKTCV